MEVLKAKNKEAIKEIGIEWCIQQCKHIAESWKLRIGWLLCG